MKYALNSLLVTSMVGCISLASGCSRQPVGPRVVHEALSERGSLPKTIYDDPYIHQATPVTVPESVSFPVTLASTPHATIASTAPATTAEKLERGPASSEVSAFRGPRKPAALAYAADPTTCSSVEFAGQGPADPNLSPTRWIAIALLFREVKEELLGWVNDRRHQFTPETLHALQTQVRTARLEKPNDLFEPDLSWRGIGVLSRNPNGATVLRVGAGFARLLETQPTRARFELTRLLAQSWAPCELARLGASNPWSGYLSCVGISEAELGCGNGSYSEAGWAISSGVAATLTNAKDLGCQLPVFKDPKYASCPKAGLNSATNTVAALQEPRK